MTCTKVCELLAGRVYPWSCALEVRAGHWTGTERSPLASPPSHALGALLSVTANCPPAHHRKGQLLSPCSSALLSHHESPVTQGGILKQLAVKIRNKSLPFSLLEPSFLSHEKDGF